jgi:hypothetical protein
MNLEIKAVTEHEGPAPPGYDLSDWLVMIMAVGGFVLPWVYIFLHPSDSAFGIGVGATVTNGSVYHALRVHDDKKPDDK